MKPTEDSAEDLSTSAFRESPNRRIAETRATIHFSDENFHPPPGGGAGEEATAIRAVDSN